MQPRTIFIAIVSTIASLLTFLPGATPAATAQQGIQEQGNLGVCSSRVVGQEPGTRVNMRSEPDINADIQDFVLVGQTVTNLVLAATGNLISRRDDQGDTWMYVGHRPSNAVGWVRADFLSSIGCQA